jgi:hypothetical protein
MEFFPEKSSLVLKLIRYFSCRMVPVKAKTKAPLGRPCLENTAIREKWRVENKKVASRKAAKVRQASRLFLGHGDSYGGIIIITTDHEQM